MKKLSSERIGETSILSITLLWGLFPILAILSYSGLDPITSLAWTTLISVFFFLGVVIVRNSWANVFTKDLLPYLFFIAIINGTLFYVFYYIGLESTSAGNSAVVATAEVLFSFLLFNVWKKEYISRKYIIGAILMIASVLIILAPNMAGLQSGDFWILAAAFIAPFGNHFQKKLRSHLSSELILLVRTIIATPLLFLLAKILGETVKIPDTNLWLIMIINGLILFGLTKIMWIEGIFRIGVTKSISLSSFSPIFTVIFAFLFLGDNPTLLQIVAIPLGIVGVYFLTRPKYEN